MISPSKAVPLGIYFEGFTTTSPRAPREVAEIETAQGKPRAVVDSVVKRR